MFSFSSEEKFSVPEKIVKILEENNKCSRQVTKYLLTLRKWLIEESIFESLSYQIEIEDQSKVAMVARNKREQIKDVLKSLLIKTMPRRVRFTTGVEKLVREGKFEEFMVLCSQKFLSPLLVETFYIFETSRIMNSIESGDRKILEEICDMAHEWQDENANKYKVLAALALEKFSKDGADYTEFLELDQDTFRMRLMRDIDAGFNTALFEEAQSKTFQCTGYKKDRVYEENCKWFRFDFRENRWMTREEVKKQEVFIFFSR